MRPIQRSEWIFPLIVALFFVIAGTIPYVHGYRSEGPDETFAGFIGRGTPGAQSYLAFARQVAEGGALVTNLYNPHAPSKAYFHPEWWLMGTASRASGLPLLFWFHTGRVCSVVAFLLAVYYLAATFLDDTRTRRGALLIIAFGAGFGWILATVNALAGSHFDLPLDAKGVTIFGYLMNKPHFIRAGVFAALQYAWFIRGDTSGKYRYFALSGLAASGHSLIRPYHIPESCLVLACYGLARLLLDRQPLRRTLAYTVVAALGHVPAIAWQVWVYLKNPLGLGAMDAWQPQMLVPLMLWLGLPFTALIIHLAGRVLCGIPGRLTLPVPALWLLSAFLLQQAHPFFPWGTESYFAWVFAPALLFMRYTGPGLSAAARRFRLPRMLAIAAMGLALLPSNLLVYTAFYTTLHAPPSPWRYYLPIATRDAIEWLKEYAPPDSVVLACHDTSAFLPRFADLRVVTGQDALTPNYRVVNEQVRRFFESADDQGFKKWFIHEQSVDFVLVGPLERALAPDVPPQLPGLRPVYQTDEVTVFAVR